MCITYNSWTHESNKTVHKWLLSTCHMLYVVNYAIIFLLYCLGYMDVRKETISPLKIGNMLEEDFSGVRFEEQKKVAS